jgi:hypothetical protein
MWVDVGDNLMPLCVLEIIIIALAAWRVRYDKAKHEGGKK